MMNAVIVGADEDGLGGALEAEGFDLVRIEGFADREALDSAGLESTDLFVITDTAHATSIPVARELNDGVRIVVYTENSLPEFAQPLADLIVDPNLLGPDAVAEEL